MTKADLEKLLQEEKDYTSQLKAEIARLRALQPISEADYTRVQERLTEAEKDADYWRSAYVRIKGELETVKKAAVKIQEDNAKLISGYYVGITQDKETREANREYNKVAAENRKLQGELEAKEQVIQYYRKLAADQTGEALGEVIKEAQDARKKAGRPREIDDGTVERIRKLKREGMTVREIHAREGVSLGKITEICRKKKGKA